MIEISKLQELITYDPELGTFTWKVSIGGNGQRNVSGSKPAGSTAGGHNDNGYYRIRIDGRSYLGHRLAWAITHGAWPVGSIDHINGNPRDNKLVNLRDVRQGENIQNQRRPHPRNTSGVLGVGKHTQYKKWLARITVDGRGQHLGVFDTVEEAQQVYLDAKRKMHTGCTI